MTAVVPLAGGKVCFEGIDCVAWGAFAAPDATVGTPFNSTAAPAAGTAARGLVTGRALVRRLDAAGGPTTLDGLDDTDRSATDFALGAPAPRNNAGAVGTPPASTCGDGALGGLEGCDDANTSPGDGCSAACQPEFCGDGAPGPGEACDDANGVSGDGCDANCTPTACGNGVVTAGETCDDANGVSGDGCDSNCTPTGCGNGVVTAGEACDDGDLASGDGCDSNCTPTGCGNGIVTAGEACEPPGVGTCGAACQRICLGAGDCADADPCTTNERCVAEACAVDPTPIDDAEACTVDSCDATGVHHAPLANGAPCTLAGQPGTRALCLTGACAASSCGDGFTDAGRGEACDDANAVDTDGCTNACALPRCGDGIVSAGEACDGGAGCTAACALAPKPRSSGGGCGAPGGPAGLALAALALAALSRRGRAAQLRRSAR